MNPTLWPTTQTEEVLALLRERPDGVTAMEALEEVGTSRLAARIADLKAAGYVIESELVQVNARNGRKARVARYRLVTP
jgi:predicted ArsR family transcriptional regulator